MTLRLPLARPYGIDLPPQLTEVGSVTRVEADGHPAWLLTRYDDVRAALVDPRFDTVRPGNATIPQLPPIYHAAGSLNSVSGAEHLRLRKALTPAFAARRTGILRPRIQRLVDELLDAMEAKAPPVDLHTELAVPLPLQVICELLGVPYEDREKFSAWCEGAVTMGPGATPAWEELAGYLRDQLARKRIEPGEDLMSDLSGLTEDEAIGLTAIVLIAGHDATSTQIEYGVLGLLRNAEQIADITPAVVEEILRLYPPGVGSGLQRFTLTDVEIAGTTIPSGSRVFLSIPASARDGGRFSSPLAFDASREHNAHMTFGHGAHHCAGAALARLELQIVFVSLFRRFPALRLAVEPEELRVRPALTGGFVSMPVTW